MIQLKKIKFIGFKDLKTKITIEFKGKTSILYGANGSGKTTVLRLINSILNQSDEILIKEKVQKIELDYLEDDEIFRININYNKNTQSYNWENLETSLLFKTKSIMIGVQRGTPKSYSSVPSRLIYEFILHSPVSREIYNVNKQERSKLRYYADEMANFLNRRRATRSRANDNQLIPEGNHISLEDINITNIENELLKKYEEVQFNISYRIYNALFETFAIAIEQENDGGFSIEMPENFIEIIVKNRYKLINALEDAPDNEFKETVIKKLSEFNITSAETLKKNKLFTKLLLQMVQELELEKIALSSINILIERFNSMIGSEKKLIIDRDGIRVKIGNDTHGLDGLSSGERHLLTFLSIILLDGSERDFILIDEPEISLNVIWQEKLISLIQELAPNSQIITASHSPSIVEDHTKSLVRIEKV